MIMNDKMKQKQLYKRQNQWNERKKYINNIRKHHICKVFTLKFT